MRKRLSRGWFSLSITILGILSLRSSFADQYVIPSSSMEPTILIGDHVGVDKRAYDLRIPFTRVSLMQTGQPRRGDVVVFTDPRDGKTNLIKRLAGLPGDRVLVQGRAVAVPPDHFYFLGDNSDNSADSREWGFVPRSALLGKARAVLYSVHWDSGLPLPSVDRSGKAL